MHDYDVNIQRIYTKPSVNIDVNNILTFQTLTDGQQFKEFLKHYLESKSMTVEEIADELSVSRASVYQYFKSKSMEPDTKKRLEGYFGVKIFDKEKVANGEYIQKPRKKTIPFFDAPAVGGIEETEMTPIHAPAGTIDVGDLLHDSQAAIRIYGNSMLPNYPPGCVVGLIKCRGLFIEPGEVYVIETRDRRLLKRLFYKDDASESDKFLCYSDNIMKFDGGSRNGKLAYPPFEIPKEEVVSLFVVTGVIKRNANSVIINR